MTYGYNDEQKNCVEGNRRGLPFGMMEADRQGIEKQEKGYNSQQKKRHASSNPMIVKENKSAGEPSTRRVMVMGRGRCCVRPSSQ